MSQASKKSEGLTLPKPSRGTGKGGARSKYAATVAGLISALTDLTKAARAVAFLGDGLNKADRVANAVMSRSDYLGVIKAAVSHLEGGGDAKLIRESHLQVLYYGARGHKSNPAAAGYGAFPTKEGFRSDPKREDWIATPLSAPDSRDAVRGGTPSSVLDRMKKA